MSFVVECSKKYATTTLQETFILQDGDSVFDQGSVTV